MWTTAADAPIGGRKIASQEKGEEKQIEGG